MQEGIGFVSIWVFEIFFLYIRGTVNYLFLVYLC
jgi:hypothetical protein